MLVAGTREIIGVFGITRGRGCIILAASSGFLNQFVRIRP
jgi:hypothetical protein